MFGHTSLAPQLHDFSPFLGLVLHLTTLYPSLIAFSPAFLEVPSMPTDQQYLQIAAVVKTLQKVNGHRIFVKDGKRRRQSLEDY